VQRAELCNACQTDVITVGVTDWVLDLTAGKAAGNLLKSGETLTEAYAHVSLADDTNNSQVLSACIVHSAQASTLQCVAHAIINYTSAADMWCCCVL
jgi:hypothetical protein